MNPTLEYASNMLMYGVISSYVLAMLLFAVAFGSSRADVSRGRAAGNVGLSITVLGTALLGGAVVTRAIAASRVPWGNMYEFSLTATFVVMTTMLILSYRWRQRWLGLLLVIPALLVLMAALLVFYTQASPLVPALRSYWLVIHVSAAVISAGAFSVGAGITGLQLLQERRERRILAAFEPSWIDELAAQLPTSAKLEMMAYRIHAFTFPLWTFAIVAGAIWARVAWSRFWGWDPKETWAFITWVGYAAYLHARVTVVWRGWRPSTIALVAFASLIFNFTAVNLFFSGLHSYSGR